ncbi:MAG: adenosylcobinamide-GDP ribazoletransferase [Methylococcaceae bacterium]|nr:adenosylcobinamide-GDP ribazoletransferase [Methylococcaceae bacterium]
MNHWQSFLIALQFLTTIPVRVAEPVSPKNSGQSLLYYPLIGLIIGGLMLVSIWVSNEQSAWVTAILTLTVWIILTGGLHLDGLADSADAWLGGLGNKERTLQIMKDPASGPIAVVVLLLVILIKLIMLVELIQHQQCLGIIITVVLARTALPLLLLTTPYVRANGLGTLLVNNMPQKSLRIVLFFVILLAVISIGILPLIVFFSVLLILRYQMLKRLNGTTGDTAGALLELIEASILTALVVL